MSPLSTCGTTKNIKITPCLRIGTVFYVTRILSKSRPSVLPAPRIIVVLLELDPNIRKVRAACRDFGLLQNSIQSKRLIHEISR